MRARERVPERVPAFISPGGFSLGCTAMDAIGRCGRHRGTAL
jgi:hypothetical protein